MASLGLRQDIRFCPEFRGNGKADGGPVALCTFGLEVQDLEDVYVR